MKIFLHGLESSGRGAKATFLRQLYPDMKTPDFKGTLLERMATLRAVLAGHRDITLIGSSFGGLMATVFAMENSAAVERVVLLAPALNFVEFSQYPLQRIEIPTRMIIGRYDTVTPAATVVPIARKIFAVLQYEEAEDDHMLARTYRMLDWEIMLTGPNHVRVVDKGSGVS
ncbi:MAG: YqiA/YcfP family alpha/beta fold hydrolase [Desulfobulbales bacterium]